ncbi:MAG: hypothetical protein OEU92_24335, partial [Alphaproteobacteria bacterium]|nr:hypothetical protein [Alphaproteobacteria bacterium]
MSESGNVHRLTLPGLVSALLVLGGGPGATVAGAAGLHQPAASLALAKTSLAQTAEQESEPAAKDPPPASDDALAADDVPFSELNEALTTARSRLAELTKAAEIAKVAGELREQLQTAEAENRQLKSVLSQLQTENRELESAKTTAERQIGELEQASEAASAEARRLDEELVSMRWQNSQLSTSLARAETTARENADELNKVRNDLSARAESLTVAADESATEIARLQRELDA